METGKNGKALYIVSTYYHALISCVKQFSSFRRADILVTEYIAEGKELAKRMEAEGLYEKTFFLEHIEEYKMKNKFDYRLNQHRRNAKKIEEQLSVRFEKYEDLYLFHDDTWAAHYCKDKRIDYHLIEDALNSFQTISKSNYAYMLPNPRWKCLIRKWLHIGYVSCGFDNCTIDVEVNDKNNLELEKFAWKKLVEVPRKKLFDALSQDDIERLKNIFARGTIPEDSGKYYLLLTRVLQEPDKTDIEEMQVRLHVDMVRKFIGDNKKLMIKPHPRDASDYSKAFPNAVILDKNMPAEIMPYIGLKKFLGVISFNNLFIEGIYAKEYFSDVLIYQNNTLKREEI